ncbi:ATPase, T2SS/T4P/T4SS family [Cysteiniphilum sp. 6C5]|uniref:ATPase, T2SS/T4P/T4SS family n=1 Tax=unclassified Cysteiniphilum TaxID=2610889 RepID=UPI003F851204
MHVLKLDDHYLNEQQFNQLLLTCAAAETTDITLQTNTPILVLRHKKRLYQGMRQLSVQEIEDIAQLIYGANAIAHLHAGNDIDTNYIVRSAAMRWRVNMTVCQQQSQFGISISLRLIKDKILPLQALNLQAEVVEKLIHLQGLTIISGATGSGKSTLIASILKAQQALPYVHKILTYESPIEYTFGSQAGEAVVSQTQIPDILPDYRYAVFNAMRRFPDVIMLGETRDFETLNALIEAALTGHACITTVHANNAADVFYRMLLMVPVAQREAYYRQLISSLSVIVWQMLIQLIDGTLVPIQQTVIFDHALRVALFELSMHDGIGYLRQHLDAKASPLEKMMAYYQRGELTQEDWHYYQQNFKAIKEI